jgi:ParB family chromosome partitioning protein
MTETHTRALGGGLEGLISSKQGGSGKPMMVRIENISPNPDQPRKQFNPDEMAKLTESIKIKGILEPLVVSAAENGYQLIVGQRRLIAAKEAGLTEVPVIIREIEDSSMERLELALIENICRDNLNPIEEAEAMRRLKDELQQTTENISKLIGKDRATISNSIRLLTLPDNIQDDIRKGNLSAGHGKAILSINDKDKWEEARNEIVSKALTVREAESLAKKFNKEAKEASPQPQKGDSGDSGDTGEEAFYEHLEKLFTDAANGLKAKIKFRGKNKRLVFYYQDNKQLETLMNKLGIVPS